MKLKKTFVIILVALLTKIVIVICFSGLGSALSDHVTFDKDEARYLDLSGQLLVGLRYKDFSEILSNYYNYTQSYHVGNYFFLAFLRLVFGDSYLALVAIKGLIYAAGTYFFSAWMDARQGARAAVFSSIALSVYMPLQFLSTSLMRDDIIFSGMAFTIFMFDRARPIKGALGLIVTATFRINASVSLFAYEITNLFLRKKSSGRKRNNILITFSAILIIGLAAIIGFSYVKGRALGLIAQFNPAVFAVDVVRFALSPLPWSLDPTLPWYLQIWYALSFWISISVSLYFLIGCIYRRWKFDWAMIAFLTTSIIPYILIENLGFRQVAPIMPFVSIPIISRMLGLDIRRSATSRLI